MSNIINLIEWVIENQKLTDDDTLNLSILLTKILNIRIEEIEKITKDHGPKDSFTVTTVFNPANTPLVFLLDKLSKTPSNKFNNEKRLVAKIRQKELLEDEILEPKPPAFNLDEAFELHQTRKVKLGKLDHEQVNRKLHGKLHPLPEPKGTVSSSKDILFSGKNRRNFVTSHQGEASAPDNACEAGSTPHSDHVSGL